MAGKQQIIITIDPGGETKLEVKGVSGSSCLDITRQLENALGVKLEDTPTGEMKQAVTHQRQEQK